MTWSSNEMYKNYRGAVALNNIGVALLERQEFKRALDTFKDAMFVVEEVMQHNGDGILQRRRRQRQDYSLDETIQRAIQRLASPSKKRARSYVDIVTHDMNQFSTIKVSLQYGPSHSIANAIRIECLGTEIPDCNRLDFESSMIIHNFAVAHMLQSQMSKNQEKTNTLLSRAVKLFQLEQYILANCTDNCHDNDDFCATQIMLLLALTLTSTIQAFMELGRTKQAKHVVLQLEIVQESLRDLEAFDIFNGQSRLAAAAA